MRGLSLVLAGCLGLVPGATAACVVALPECPTSYGMAYFYDSEATAVLFTEHSSGLEPERAILVECTSRRGVMIVDDQDDPEPYWQSMQHFHHALADDAPYTLDEVLNHARALGARVSRIRLSEGHCGCDLPSIPPPPTFCPTD